MIRRSFRVGTLLAIVLIAMNVALAVVTNVPTHVTASDEAIFRTILGLKRPEGRLSYDDEVKLILNVQRLVLDQVPVGEPIPEFNDREPEDLFRNKSGLCYDRSRTYDKVFSWLGLESRHVYVLYPEDPVTQEKLSYWKIFFVRGSNSHAVTEVKTSRGWIVVDSNSTWISVAKDGTPVDADHIHARARSFETIPPYFDREFLPIRGLYSRRGQFYRPYVPYPEFNWVDFFSWLAIG